MSKVLRKEMKMFGSDAGPTQIGQFGSLAAGSIAYTTDPDSIQSLANYLQGWFGAVVGNNSPAIEDMNALCYLYAYQLVYLFQTGVAEWDTDTIYYIGSLANDGLGNLYKSLTDDNTGNALTDTTNWAPFTTSAATNQIDPTTDSPYSLGASDNGKTFMVDSSLGAQTFNLPAPVANFTFTIKDVGFDSVDNPITLARNGSEELEGLAADYTMNSLGGVWTWVCDGTNWNLI